MDLQTEPLFHHLSKVKWLKKFSLAQQKTQKWSVTQLKSQVCDPFIIA